MQPDHSGSELKMFIVSLSPPSFKSLELQHKIENAGGEKLKNQKLKVNKIQTVSAFMT